MQLIVVLRTLDVAILVATVTMTDGETDHFTPLRMSTQGNNDISTSSSIL